MSTRDELAADLFQHLPIWLRVDRMTTGVDLADALIAEGWRKKPSRLELLELIEPYTIDTAFAFELTDAILALMDRGQ